MLRLANAERARAGCRPLILEGHLQRAAQAHTEWQAASGTMSHTGPGGSTMGDRARAAGYPWSRIAENVAQGYPSPAAAMKGWMSSAGHRANLLDCRLVHVGIGYADRGRGPYWTQLFGTP